MRIKITVKCKWNLIVKCKWGLIVYHALVTGILLGNLPQGPLGSANATFNEVQRGLAPTKAIIVSEQMGGAFLPGGEISFIWLAAYSKHVHWGQRIHTGKAKF